MHLGVKRQHFGICKTGSVRPLRTDTNCLYVVRLHSPTDRPGQLWPWPNSSVAVLSLKDRLSVGATHPPYVGWGVVTPGSVSVWLQKRPQQVGVDQIWKDRVHLSPWPAE